MLTTDLNQRERARFASCCREIAKAATELAEALDSGDDTKMMVSFIVFSLSTSALKELHTIVMEAASKAKTETSATDFLTLDESAALL